MNRAEIIIIGAGSIGLAIARRLSKTGRNIVLLERHSSFGQDTSTRNSEVIHGGMYYPTDSLKARLCVDGNRMLYELCSKHAVLHRKTGKLIIANTENERKNIEEIYHQGQINHVSNLQMIGEQEIKKIEPNIRAKWALLSPESGILDATELMRYFEQEALANGVTIRYDHEVVGLENRNNDYKVIVRRDNGKTEEITTDVVINAAGLYADKISTMLGIDIENAGYRIYWVKGEYFDVNERHRGKMSHLIYPTPTPVSLGIHVRMRLDGTFALGPNALYVDEINYDVDPIHLDQFFSDTQKYLPFLEKSDLTPGIAGIRAKLQAKGETAKDFIIRHEDDKGLPGFINLVGIDSPALTACMAIAEEVAGIYKEL
ncbi:MAG: NAD(P)/FAD-dependent oxidoreductase [Candidatus Marinimicrobia bacterium]|nr:NAD(P)/FAD-dependent oxidoreductase [Candidatus Neomarinimicrobiota bacterium]